MATDVNLKAVCPTHCVVGVFEDIRELQRLIQNLKANGLPTEQISALTHRGQMQGNKQEFPQDQTISQAEKGALFGGLVGALMGAAVFTIPGVGQILAVGPIAMGIATAVNLAVTGSIVGGLLGAMNGWGVPKDQTSYFESLIEQGKSLLIVHGEPQAVATAQEVMQEEEVEEVHLFEGTSSESQEILDPPLD
ncbi:Hypothetical protein PBC10988_41230 [Planctomycetales bacterium 10988]|nr:Hypothetical protein PBC10988_41230 [Planctomycetales bacterium 10988]